MRCKHCGYSDEESTFKSVAKGLFGIAVTLTSALLAGPASGAASEKVGAVLGERAGSVAEGMAKNLVKNGGEAMGKSLIPGKCPKCGKDL